MRGKLDFCHQIAVEVGSARIAIAVGAGADASYMNEPPDCTGRLPVLDRVRIDCIFALPGCSELWPDVASIAAV